VTEAEWLTSEDPARMLRLYTTDEMPWPHGTPAPAVSDRKLRLFAVACWRDQRQPNVCLAKCIIEAERYADGDRTTKMRNLTCTVVSVDAATAARSAAENAAVPVEREGQTTKPRMAAILRDIVGNPFRPMTLPPGDECRRCRGEGSVSAGAGGQVVGMEPRRRCGNCKGRGFRSNPWLTPTVLALAEAAYAERGRKCDKCSGSGWVRVHDGGTREDGYGWKKADCPDCGGTGTINGGTLDNARLAVLSDALEEAGCDDAGLLMHLRGEEWHQPSGGGLCKRPTGPHWRGCWAVDCVLGEG